MRRQVRYINNKNNITKRVETKNVTPFIYLSIALGLFLLAQLLNLSIVGTKGAELAQIRADQKQTEENIRLLEAEISEATSLDRIEMIATEMLEMKKAENVKYINDGGYISTANLGE